MKASAFLNFSTLSGFIPEPMQMAKDDEPKMVLQQLCEIFIAFWLDLE